MTATASYTTEIMDSIVQLYGEAPLLTRAEEAALFVRLAAGDEAARGEIIAANLRLVINIASKFHSDGMELPDLIQEGSIGLMRAASDFDISRGWRFSTYATYWIRQAITRAIMNKARVIRLPVHMAERVAKIRRAQEGQASAMSVDALAAAIGEDAERVRNALGVAEIVASLEQDVGFLPSKFPRTLKDCIPADDPDIDDTAAERDAHERLAAALASLPERERIILEMRCGWGGRQCHTLDQIGLYFGVTRARVRQIEKEALGHLREHAGMYGLEGLL